jgi:hypothetical protein
VEITNIQAGTASTDKKKKNRHKQAVPYTCIDTHTQTHTQAVPYTCICVLENVTGKHTSKNSYHGKKKNWEKERKKEEKKRKRKKKKKGGTACG